MTPERFQHIEELYHAARERTAEERAALLAQVEPELRREVESLLAERIGGGRKTVPPPELAREARLRRIARDLTHRTLTAERVLRELDQSAAG